MYIHNETCIGTSAPCWLFLQGGIPHGMVRRLILLKHLQLHLSLPTHRLKQFFLKIIFSHIFILKKQHFWDHCNLSPMLNQRPALTDLKRQFTPRSEILETANIFPFNYNAIHISIKIRCWCLSYILLRTVIMCSFIESKIFVLS